MIRYWCALPFNLNSNVIIQISYRITKHYVYKMRMFNHSLHFIETKAVLEGRGFRPQIFGKEQVQSWTHFDAQKPGFLLDAVCNEVDARKTRFLGTRR